MNRTAPAILLRGGTVIDGTAAPPFLADVRLRDGVIAEVGSNLEREAGERIFDASGCYVAPGFIESHTHVDGMMWWQPDLEPLPGNGVTTVIMGNCGFALAPVAEDPAVRAEMIKIFSFFEDFPEAPFFQVLPWDMPPWPKDEEMVVRLLKDPMSVSNISDAGAHGQMFCGMGYNIMLFSHFVRETGALSVEEAVHAQTGKLANHFGLHDRGEIAAGKRADVTLFDLDEVEDRPQRKTYDVPDGEGGHTWRWTRDPAPVRLTVVNGVSTFEDGKSTGARPGEMLAPVARA